MVALQPPPQHPDTQGMLSAALAYAQRGWHVFPLHSPGRQTFCDCGDAACTSEAKHPWVKSGFQAATTDEATIRRWWRKWPRANIGIACGASGLVALDVDARHGGEASLVELVKRHAGAKAGQLTPAMEALCATLTSETGGGGAHYVYRAQAGIDIRNAQELDDLAGLDVRGNGGYLVAAPSLHASGARYLWREGVSDPQPLPDWLVPVLTRRAPRRPAQSVATTPPPASGSGVAAAALAASGAYWLERALRLAHEGNRNDKGFWLACQLRDSGLSEDAAADLLEDYAARVPGSDYSSTEAFNSLRSAYKAAPRENARSASASAASSASSASSAITAASSALAAPIMPARAATEPATASAARSPADDAGALGRAGVADGSETTATTTSTATATAERLRFQFLTDEEVENMPPPVWLIGGFLVADRLSVVYGEYASYKSFLTMDWALSVATGTPWQGQPVQQGPVVYIAGEGIGGLGKRMRAWKTHHGWQGSAPIHLLGEAPQLLRAGDVADLLTALAALPTTPALVVIDTLARAMVGGDENSAQDMGIAVAAAEAIRAATHAHVLIVHHKPSGANKTRGSNALPGGVETTIDITKDANVQGLITISCGKQKDAANFEPRSLRFETVVLDEGGLESSGVLVLDDQDAHGAHGPRRAALPRSAREVLSLIQAAHGITWGDLKRRFLQETGQSLRSLSGGLDILEHAGMIENVSGFWRVKEEHNERRSEGQAEGANR